MVDVNVDRSSISFIKVEIYGLNVNGCMAGYNDFLSASMTLNAANLTKYHSHANIRTHISAIMEIPDV